MKSAIKYVNELDSGIEGSTFSATHSMNFKKCSKSNFPADLSGIGYRAFSPIVERWFRADCILLSANDLP
jgi:hypothetical protein